MAVIKIAFGKGLGELAASRNDGNDLRSILVDLVADIATIRAAIIAEAVYGDARTTITAATVNTTVE
jgi:hypothetical protein